MKYFHLLALLAWALYVPTSRATDYYIHATDGNDDNFGTEPNLAWQSIEKVNSFSFSAGDNIYFAKGEIFRGELRFRSSGTPEQPITISSYGEGEKPKFLGSWARNNQTDWIEDPDSNGTLWHTTHSTIGPELVSNPTFDSDLDGWVFDTSSAEGASASVEQDPSCNCLKVTCVDSGTSGYGISLHTAGIPVESGKYYALTYSAKADIPFTPYWTRIKQNTDPWTEYHSRLAKDDLETTNEWKTYTIRYQIHTTDANARINWPLGDLLPAGGTFYLDNVSFKEIDPPSFFPYDVGFILLGEETQENVGIKVWDKSELDADKEFWYDEDRWQIYLYSPQNPVLEHSGVEIVMAYYEAFSGDLVDISHCSHVIFENISIRYANSFGFYLGSGGDFLVRDVDIGYCGGQKQSETYRTGSAFRLAGDITNCTIENSHVFQTYAQGFFVANVGDGTPRELRNITIRGNLIENCSDGIEVAFPD